MGQWLATVEFPDGLRRYARYSTVVESVLSELYPSVDRSGPRAVPAGEPSRGRPGAPPGAPVPVVISVEPDDRRWHGLFDPARDVLIGPYSPHHRSRLQASFALLSDFSDIRHLSADPPSALCGRTTTGTELPFHRPPNPFGVFADTPDLSDIDLFVSWASGSVCRDCLLATL